MLSIGGKAEKTATDNLREVIDRCREPPGALFMYAVPPDFLNTVVPKYPALQQRVQAANYFSRSNPFSPQIDLEHLDIPTRSCWNRSATGCCRSSSLRMAPNWIRRCKPPTSMRSPPPRATPTWLSATAASSLRRWSLSGIAKRKKARWR